VSTREEVRRRATRNKPQWGCLGCLGSITAAVIGPTVIYLLITPWTFHMGGRWTPLERWDAVGRLRDSAGEQYGLYVRLAPFVNMDLRDGRMDCCELNGNAQVCTAGGAKYGFDLRGGVSGAWLRTDGSKVTFTLIESRAPRLPRQFYLSGVWRGPNLVLGDQGSMFHYFLPGGNLSPRPTTGSEDHNKSANVTVSWGSLSDFESICAGLRNSRRDANH
jgi:hypothetical protein